MSPVMTTQTTDRKMKARTRTAQAKRSPPAKSPDNEISNTPAGPSSSPVVASIVTAQSKTTAESGTTMAIPKSAVQTPDQTVSVAAPPTLQKRRKIPSVCRSYLNGRCKNGDQCPRRHPPRESATTSQKRAHELDKSMQCTPVPDDLDEYHKDEDTLSSPSGAVDTTPRTDSSQETDNRSEATSINKEVNQKTQTHHARSSICWSYMRGRCKNGDQCPRRHGKGRQPDANKPLPSDGRDGIAVSTNDDDDESLKMTVDRSKASVSGQPQFQVNPSQLSHEDILEMTATTENTAARMPSSSEPENELRNLSSAAADGRPSRMPSPVYTATLSSKVCNFWMQGQCEYGERCHRTHITSPAGNISRPGEPHSAGGQDQTQSHQGDRYRQALTSTGASQIDDRPRRTSDVVCRDFVRGRCRFGYCCYRTHILGEQRRSMCAPSQVMEDISEESETSDTVTHHAQPPVQKDSVPGMQYPTSSVPPDTLQDPEAGNACSDAPALPDDNRVAESTDMQSKASSIALPPRHNHRQTDEICRNFQQGRCPWGSRCHRRHVPASSLASPLSSSSTSQGQADMAIFATRPGPTNIIPPTHDLPVKPITEINAMAFAARGSVSPGMVSDRDRAVYRPYLRGECPKGDGCRFVHPTKFDSPATSAPSSVSRMTPQPVVPPLRDALTPTPSTKYTVGPSIGLSSADARTSTEAPPVNASLPSSSEARSGSPPLSESEEQASSWSEEADDIEKSSGVVLRKERRRKWKGKGKAAERPLSSRPAVTNAFNVEVTQPDVVSLPPSDQCSTEAESSGVVVNFPQPARYPDEELMDALLESPEDSWGPSTSYSDWGDLSFSSSSSMQASVSSSAPSTNTPSTPTGPAIPICWDFMHGRCYRAHCRFLHDDPLKMKSRQHENSSLPSGDVDGRLGIPPARKVPPPPSLIPTFSQPKPSNAVSPIVIPPSRAEYPPLHTKITDVRSDIPLVPPGLGLEARVLGSDASTLPKEPPKPATLTVLDATRVTFGPGFEVQRLVTGFESRQVMFRHIPQGVTSAEITSVLQPFGETVAVTLYDNVKRDGTIAAKATFAEHEQASQAASALDGSLLFGSNISARLLTFSDTMVGKGSLADGTVYLEFPSAHKTGFVGYASRKLAEEAIAKANGTEMREALVSAAIFEGLPSVGTVTVRFLGLPANTRAEELARYGKNEGVMMTQPNYNSTSTAIGRLREILTGYGELLSFNALPPPYRHSTVRVWAHFDSSEIAEIVRVNFHWRRKQFCGSGRIVARHIRSLKYSLPVEVYKALSADIRLLSSYIWTTEASSSISVLDKHAAVGGRVMIKLVSQNMPSLARLKTHFERLLRGEKLVENGEVVWDGFFSRRGGILFLEELERRFPDVLVNRDPRRRTLALFGPVHKRQIVRSIILTRVARMRAQKTHVIPLDGRLIGLFMNADLAALRQQFGPENVMIDLWERVLRIRGDDEAYRVARTAVERARTRHEDERQQRESDCPVCLDEATLPVALDCGHQWCKSCLHNYLLAATDNKVFPLTCLGNEASCKHPIPISTAQELLSTNEFDALVHASFLAYVHSRPSEFHYCPTPDCPQVYRKGRKNTILQCPSCLVRICPFCHVQYHEGSSCQDREAEDRKLFEEWKKGRDVKDCPSCKAPIERAAGCNHMTCTRCNTHICWACLATFSTGEEVYDHMHNLHGGIGA